MLIAQHCVTYSVIFIVSEVSVYWQLKRGLNQAVDYIQEISTQICILNWQEQWSTYVSMEMTANRGFWPECYDVITPRPWQLLPSALTRLQNHLISPWKLSEIYSDTVVLKYYCPVIREKTFGKCKLSLNPPFMCSSKEMHLSPFPNHGSILLLEILLITRKKIALYVSSSHQQQIFPKYSLK